MDKQTLVIVEFLLQLKSYHQIDYWHVKLWVESKSTYVFLWPQPVHWNGYKVHRREGQDWKIRCWCQPWAQVLILFLTQGQRCEDPACDITTLISRQSWFFSLRLIFVSPSTFYEFTNWCTTNCTVFLRNLEEKYLINLMSAKAMRD